MRYRPVDENGDMVPILSLSDLKEGREAVALAVMHRLKLINGEWWENEDLGFRMWDYLIASAKAGQADFLMSYITSYIMETEGCTGMTDVSIDYSNRQLVYKGKILTEFGTQEIEAEVGDSGIL